MPDLLLELPLAELDPIGGEADNRHLVATAVLGDMTEHWCDVHDLAGSRIDKLAVEKTNSALHSLADQGHSLATVILKLAVALRLAGSAGQEAGEDQVYRLNALALADLICLREAELARRRVLAEAGGQAHG